MSVVDFIARLQEFLERGTIEPYIYEFYMRFDNDNEEHLASRAMIIEHIEAIEVKWLKDGRSIEERLWEVRTGARSRSDSGRCRVGLIEYIAWLGKMLDDCWIDQREHDVWLAMPSANDANRYECYCHAHGLVNQRRDRGPARWGREPRR